MVKAVSGTGAAEAGVSKEESKATGPTFPCLRSTLGKKVGSSHYAYVLPPCTAPITEGKSCAGKGAKAGPVQEPPCCTARKETESQPREAAKVGSFGFYRTP